MGTPDTVTIRAGNSGRNNKVYSNFAAHEKSSIDGVPLSFYAHWSNPAQIADRLRQQNRRFSKEVVSRVCNGELSSFISKFCMALSMYVPDFGHNKFGYSSFVDTLGNHHFPIYGPFDECAEYMYDNQISLIPDISLSKYIEWVTQCSGFWSGLPETNVDRGLNYISHSFDRDIQNYSFEQFVWLMAAIEAIYCNSTSAISEKLRDRISIILPDFSHIFTRKSINKLYEFRSKFLHGSMKIPNKFISDNLERTTDYVLEFSDRKKEASVICLQTIQALAKENRKILNFQESAF